jgi:hypothetical protein
MLLLKQRDQNRVKVPCCMSFPTNKIVIQAESLLEPLSFGSKLNRTSGDSCLTELVHVSNGNRPGCFYAYTAAGEIIGNGERHD